MIRSLLIANRGEIACRIMRSARQMGIRTIAVYSEADEAALHVRLADQAYLLGPAAAADSYLRTGRILKIAKEAGADAVHPGYGFLSENADFAQLTMDAGMIFVGPPPTAIRAMGLKDKAKEIMAAAGVPVVPGFHGSNQDPTFLKRKAYEIGYPVLIKAVAGGGGKGMRKVMKAIEFDAALEAAKREAMSAFGNDRVLIEKFVQNPRHIEIQVFADSHDNVVHLFERDCSLQRRHQKVIEEAPAPGMTESLRAAMGEAACSAAKAVGYQGAGTVEFIVDGSGSLNEDGFYFMEMNTRLQVEHPVTEAISGTDLVEWQIRVARGEQLPLSQQDLTISGHAVEARIYAEDPDAGFLPSTGRLIALDLGRSGNGVRIDAGVEKGDAITPFYDPMIAKLIVHAATREEALETLEQRLRTAQIAGPATNLAFLAKLSADADFRAGTFDTGLIDKKLEELTVSTAPDEAILATGIAGLVANLQMRLAEECASRNGSVGSPWEVCDSFQLLGHREVDQHYRLNGEHQVARVRFDSGKILVRSDDDVWIAPAQNVSVFPDGEGVYVVCEGRQSVFTPHQFELTEDGEQGSDGAVRVPMHGKIISVTVADGDAVEKGDILFAVEAMKMEHAVLAPHDGKVDALTVAVGEQVEDGHLALRLNPTGGI